jgi:hypothetical protein
MVLIIKKNIKLLKCGSIKVRILKIYERINKRIYLFGFKNKKREINNRNKETCNKGNLIMESRGHRVKSKKESQLRSY